MGFEFYIDAFSELSTERQVGMSIGPIPFSSIVSYAKLYQVEDFEEFLFVMRKMDEVFLKNSNGVSSGKSDKTNSNKGS